MNYELGNDSYELRVVTDELLIRNNELEPLSYELGIAGDESTDVTDSEPIHSKSIFQNSAPTHNSTPNFKK